MTLTTRQAEVLELLGKGLQNKEVAHALEITTRAVEIHRQNIMSVARAHNAVQLGIWAERHGYIRSNPPAESAGFHGYSHADATAATVAGGAV